MAVVRHLGSGPTGMGPFDATSPKTLYLGIRYEVDRTTRSIEI